MGGALLESWLKQQFIQPQDVVLIEPNVARAKHYRDTYSLYTFETLEAVNTGLGATIILFAVKPQVMDDVTPAYRSLAEKGSLVLSIAAGKPIRYFEAKLGKQSSIVRAMPNTPASIGKGITVLCANKNVEAKQRKQCEDLMSAVGKTCWIEDEGLMDPVTALSGSGPAYVFLLIEALTHAGIEAGLTAQLAHDLSVATVAGASLLAESSSEPPSVLRRNVTSPGGTTEAALQVLMADDALQNLFSKAIDRAIIRSKSLANEPS